MKRLKETLAQELAAVREVHGGHLRPADVVEYARDPQTALHSQFEWDDTEAAHQYRLQQAGRIIRMEVEVIVEGREPIRANVSLLTDRQAGLGYRRMVDVLSDEDLSRQLLSQALSELRSVQRRYAHLEALSRVWVEVDRTEADHSQETRQSA